MQRSSREDAYVFPTNQVIIDRDNFRPKAEFGTEGRKADKFFTNTPRSPLTKRGSPKLSLITKLRFGKDHFCPICT